MDRWECILRRICRMIGEDSDLRIWKRPRTEGWSSFTWVVDIYDNSKKINPIRFTEKTRQEAVLRAILDYSIGMNLLSDAEYDTGFLLNPGIYEELDMALSVRGV